MSVCLLCPNLCGVDRSRERGKCFAGVKAVVNRAAPHFYEEPPISGTRGSGTIFFGGCTMRCIYCQNYEISRTPLGREVDAAGIADIIKKLEAKGVHNINLVTATQYVDSILEALDIFTPHIPVVYNSSGYERAETIERIKDKTSIFLPDFKYADGGLACELSGRRGYPEAAEEAIDAMLKARPSNVYDDGIMKEGVIIRHLVLPYHLDNSRRVLDTIKNKWGTSLTLSLMAQFTPTPHSGMLDRPLKPIEYKSVVAYAEKLGFTDVFIQSTKSASDEYVPEWNKFDL